MKKLSAKAKKRIMANVTGYALILPLLIGLVVFTLYPLFVSLFNSFFYNYDGFSPYEEFEFGFGNYLRAFTGYESEIFWKSIGITFSYAGIMVPLGLVLSFIVALFLNQGLKGIGVFRLLYYIPCLIPSIVQSMIYLYIFNPNYGVMNDIFAGLGFEKSQFFDSPNYNAVLTFMFMNLFGVGGSMLIWLAGLKSVPQTYYEAAKIEGGGYFYSLVRITIPLCSPYIFYLLITNVIATLQICGNAYMISSSGGVDNNLLFFGLYIYRTFMNNNFGYSSALAYLLFIVIAALSALLFRFNKYVYYEGDN